MKLGVLEPADRLFEKRGLRPTPSGVCFQLWSRRKERERRGEQRLRTPSAVRTRRREKTIVAGEGNYKGELFRKRYVNTFRCTTVRPHCRNRGKKEAFATRTCGLAHSFVGSSESRRRGVLRIRLGRTSSLLSTEAGEAISCPPHDDDPRLGSARVTGGGRGAWKGTATALLIV